MGALSPFIGIQTDETSLRMNIPAMPKPSSEPQEILLTIDSLTKRFPQVVANDCLSLDIFRGETHCLLGENGAGKSTLAECLYGFLTPDSGKIFFKGQEVLLNSPSDAIRLGIGMVHQHFVLVQPLTVIENIIVGTRSADLILNYPKVEERVQALCDEYGVKLDLKAQVWQLSVGEQQWVEILKALYEGVELLILDEPTAVLTPQEAERLFTVLRRMNQEGISVLLITHKLQEVMDVSDRVTVLRKGQKVGTVKTSEVTKEDLARMMVGREVVFRVEKEQLPKGETVLEIRNVHALNDRGQEALSGVSFKICKNEILGIAGVSGNGQRELFEILMGARRTSQGEILLNGKPIHNLSPQEIAQAGLLHIPEDRILEGLIPDFTIEENLILGRQREKQFNQGKLLNFSNIRNFALESIQAFEIATPSPIQKTKNLSGGNLQKVILARELTQSPHCILANQPTRGLDVGATEYVHRRLLDQRMNGAAILLISEDLDELFNLSDEIAVIYKGEFVGLFDPRQVTLERIGLLMAGIKGAA